MKKKIQNTTDVGVVEVQGVPRDSFVSFLRIPLAENCFLFVSLIKVLLVNNSVSAVFYFMRIVNFIWKTVSNSIDFSVLLNIVLFCKENNDCKLYINVCMEVQCSNFTDLF